MEKKEAQGVRINKYISDYGFCSRREADKLITDERVTINNRLATHGDRVADTDTVRIDGEHLAFVPHDARPKKHRWGPPKNVPEAEDASAVGKVGKRGAARNVRHNRNNNVATSGKVVKNKKSDKQK